MEVPIAGGDAMSCIGTFTMPDCDITLTGEVRGAGSDDSDDIIEQNTLTISPKKKTLKRAGLTKAKSFTIKAKNAKGKVTYTALEKAKKAGIKVTAKGKVTIPKNCKKGTYKIRVRAEGNEKFKAKTLYKVITVK